MAYKGVVSLLKEHFSLSRRVTAYNKKIATDKTLVCDSLTRFSGLRNADELDYPALVSELMTLFDAVNTLRLTMDKERGLVADSEELIERAEARSRELDLCQVCVRRPRFFVNKPDGNVLIEQSQERLKKVIAQIKKLQQGLLAGAHSVLRGAVVQYQHYICELADWLGGCREVEGVKFGDWGDAWLQRWCNARTERNLVGGEPSNLVIYDIVSGAGSTALPEAPAAAFSPRP